MRLHLIVFLIFS